MMDLEIKPLVACGPLRLGASQAEVAKAIGEAEKGYLTHGPGWEEVRTASPFYSCCYVEDKLTSVTLDHARIANVWINGLEVMRTPLSDVLVELDQMNNGTGQAQGGSLYYTALGLGLLQFEDPSAREMLVFVPNPETQDPLRPVTPDDAIAYALRQPGVSPNSDWFGRMP